MLKKRFGGLFSFLSVLLSIGCAGNPSPVVTTEINSGLLTLDQALNEAAIRIDERIPAGSKIAPLNFNSPHDRFSNYVLEELTANLVDSRQLIVVDRREIDLIREEFDFQLSGEVADDSMQRMGQMLGAQSIISGTFTDLGGFYRIMIRVLDVQNATVEVQYRANIISDTITAALLTGGRVAAIQRAPVTGTIPATQITQAPIEQVAQAPVAVIPIQPTTPIREGIWRLSGQERGVRWDADLIIRNFRNNQFTGTLDWFEGPSERFRGREYFEGSFNELRQIIFMRGIRTAQGLGLGQYQARVTSDVRLTDGTWQGGTFTAVWVREE